MLHDRTLQSTQIFLAHALGHVNHCLCSIQCSVAADSSCVPWSSFLKLQQTGCWCRLHSSTHHHDDLLHIDRSAPWDILPKAIRTSYRRSTDCRLAGHRI